jgi:hypothetical protein
VLTVDDVRAMIADLPRAYETVVADRIKFKVGRIVFVAFSRDETTMGFGYPREHRDALVADDPVRFFLPDRRNLRYQWVCARMAELTPEQARPLIHQAWTMAVPKRVAADYAAGRDPAPA